MAEEEIFLQSVPHGCACGNFGDIHRRCTCTPAVMQRSMAKISGPLMDRIDIHIDVPAVHYRDLSATSDGEHSAQIRQRVQQARRMQVKSPLTSL
jgi:magnesium chelatase family protein